MPWGFADADSNKGIESIKANKSASNFGQRAGETKASYWLNYADFEKAGDREHFALLAIRRAIAETLTPEEQTRVQNRLANTCQRAQPENVAQADRPLNDSQWQAAFASSSIDALTKLLGELEPVKDQTAASMHALISVRLADLYSNQKQHSQAIIALRKVKQGTPYSLLAGQRLAQAYYLSGDRKSAIQVWLALAENSKGDLDAIKAQLYAANALAQEHAEQQADQHYLAVASVVEKQKKWLNEHNDIDEMATAGLAENPDKEQSTWLALFRHQYATIEINQLINQWASFRYSSACLSQQQDHLRYLTALGAQKKPTWQRLDLELANMQRTLADKQSQMEQAYAQAANAAHHINIEDVATSSPNLSLNEKIKQLKAQSASVNLQREPEMTNWDLTHYNNNKHAQAQKKAVQLGGELQQINNELAKVLLTRQQLAQLKNNIANQITMLSRMLRTATAEATQTHQILQQNLKKQLDSWRQNRLVEFDKIERQAALGRLELLDRSGRGAFELLKSR